MGTDIHIQAEYLDSESGQWIHVLDPVITCWSCDGTGTDKRTEKPCYWCNQDPFNSEDPDDRAYEIRHWVPEVGKRREEWYGDRNYNLFGILADVRNGTGFAGVDTGDAWPVIAMPRGLPDDMSPEVTKYCEYPDHTPSWLTLDEIFAYDWEGTKCVQRGWVGAEEYKVFQENGRPESWSGGVSGTSVSHISNGDMELYLLDAFGTHGKTPYTQVTWSFTAAEIAEVFLERMHQLRAAVDELESGAKVRIVFYFDS